MMVDQFIDENRDKIGRPEMSVIGVPSQQVLIISQNIKCMSEYVYAHIHFYSHPLLYKRKLPDDCILKKVFLKIEKKVL